MDDTKRLRVSIRPLISCFRPRARIALLAIAAGMLAAVASPVFGLAPEASADPTNKPCGSYYGTIRNGTTALKYNNCNKQKAVHVHYRTPRGVQPTKPVCVSAGNDSAVIKADDDTTGRAQFVRAETTDHRLCGTGIRRHSIPR